MSGEKSKRSSTFVLKGPQTTKKLRHETSEKNKAEGTLPTSKFFEAQLSCNIHIVPNDDEKRKTESVNLLKVEFEKIISCVCALLNGVGGVVKLQNLEGGTPKAKDVDIFKGKLDEKLNALLYPPSTYDEFFDFENPIEKDQDIYYLFVKRFSWRDEPCTAFLKSNLYFKNDHGVRQASGVNVVEQLYEQYKFKSQKESNNFRYQLEDLPKIPSQYIYNTEIQTLLESKRVQLKASKSEGISAIKIHKDAIKKNISAFANTDGGHIFIGIEDNLNIEGINCKGKEKQIRKEITRIINEEMVWGSESLTPVEDYHWKILFYKVQGSPNGAKVIVISVAGLEGIGGVYVDNPESYKSVDDLTSLATSLQKLKLCEVQREVCQKQDFLAKVPDRFRNSSSSCIASVEGSCEKIRSTYFKMDKGCPLVPKGFSTDGQHIITQIRELCAGDMGLIVGAQSWQSYLGGETEEGVVCDILLISRSKGMFLYTVAKKGLDVSNYNFRTATLFKRKLVAEGGMLQKFFITGHVIPIDCIPNPASIFSTPRYPDTYSVTDANSRAKCYLLLRALVIVVASYPSILANRLGLEFLNLLTEQQFEILWEHGINSNETHELWIRGGAGTGKTCVAVAFMRDLIWKGKGVTKENILYVCENKGLRKFIEQFKVAHSVCRKTFMKRNFPNIKHVILDEAQNFRLEDGDWLVEARGIVNKSSGYLWVFLDSNQQTHEFATGLPELRYQQPSFKLRNVIRNSVNIYKYSMQFLTKEDNDNSLEVKHNFKGDQVSIIPYSGSTEACVCKTLKDLANDGVEDHEIAVLLSTQKEIEKFQLDGTNFVNEEENAGQNIVLTSIRKYSGLERPVIILVDPTAGMNQSSSGIKYLGTTRANVKLIILNRSESPSHAEGK